MKRLEMTKKLSLILSCLSLSMCAAAPFPKEKVYVVDLANEICAEYEIYNLDQILMRLSRELDLVAGGPCDRMVGFNTRGFKKVQNWIRDQIKESSN